MKDCMAAAAVRTARYRRLMLPTDLPAFIEEHGYPVVVKPVDAAGSRGVRVLKDFIFARAPAISSGDDRHFTHSS